MDPHDLPAARAKLTEVEAKLAKYRAAGDAGNTQYYTEIVRMWKEYIARKERSRSDHT